MALELRIKYEKGGTCFAANDLNEKQAAALFKYMKSGKNGMKQAIITRKRK